MKIKLVRATAQHLDDCVAAVRDSNISKYFDSDASARDFFQRAMEADQLYVGIGEHNETLGLVKYVPQGGFHRSPYIHVFAVKRAHRHQGVGTALLRTFERQILTDSRRVFLLVAAFNTTAQEFYRKNGYQEVGRIPDYYLDGVTEIILMKILPEAGS